MDSLHQAVRGGRLAGDGGADGGSGGPRLPRPPSVSTGGGALAVLVCVHGAGDHVRTRWVRGLREGGCWGGKGREVVGGSEVVGGR